MLSQQLKLYALGALVALGSILAIIFKVQSKRLDKAKENLVQEKANNQVLKSAVVQQEVEAEKAKEVTKVHEKVSNTSAKSDRDFMRKRSRSDNDNRE